MRINPEMNFERITEELQKLNKQALEPIQQLSKSPMTEAKANEFMSLIGSIHTSYQNLDTFMSSTASDSPKPVLQLRPPKNESKSDESTNEEKKSKRIKCKDSERCCQVCGSTTTPEWRTFSNKLVCNACGCTLDITEKPTSKRRLSRSR